MKIGIDARMMGKGFGLARYVEQLILHLLQTDKKNEYVLFLKKEQFFDPFLFPQNTSYYKKVLADIPWYSWKEQVEFLQILNREDVDLFHFPHWNVPYFFKRPYVVTIHDLTMFHYSRSEATTLGPIKFWIKDCAHRILLRKVVKQSRHILTVSDFTKNDIQKTLQVPLSKMSVTYQAPFETTIQEKCVSPTQTKSYVLYVGAAYPHKNLEGLLKAWKIFQKKHGQAYDLLLVGKDNYFYNRLQQKFPAEVFANSVKYKGFASDAELVSLYENAELFIFPSFYEGFGLPPLEAMAHGIPVVASNQSSLPEVLGDAALFFDPKDPEHMAEMLHQGLLDQQMRGILVKKGLERVRMFSWEHLAQKTLAVYEFCMKK